MRGQRAAEDNSCEGIHGKHRSCLDAQMPRTLACLTGEGRALGGGVVVQARTVALRGFVFVLWTKTHVKGQTGTRNNTNAYDRGGPCSWL